MSLTAGLQSLLRGPSNKRSSSKRVAKCDTVFVAYRFCGHPTEEQASDLNQNIGASRFMWNRMLSDYKLMWKMYGISIPMTPADYKDVSGLEWLNDRDSLALANVQLNLEKARSDYFPVKKVLLSVKKNISVRILIRQTELEKISVLRMAGSASQKLTV